MLVTAISMFRAISMQHNAAFGMMQNHENSLSLLRSVNGRNPNFRALAAKDLNNDLANAKYQLMYQMASAQRDQCKAMLKEETKSNKLNYLS